LKPPLMIPLLFLQGVSLRWRPKRNAKHRRMPNCDGSCFWKHIF